MESDQVPRSIVTHLNSAIPPERLLASFKVTDLAVGDNKLASLAAFEQAKREGFEAEVLTNELQGEAREVGMILARRLRDETSRRKRPFCLIAGRENNRYHQGQRQRGKESGTKGPSDHSAAGGIEYYNPRRPQKYWTAPDARHNTYEEAAEALAREFGIPRAWVERHLGDANDIGLIRQALINAQIDENGK